MRDLVIIGISEEATASSASMLVRPQYSIVYEQLMFLLKLLYMQRPLWLEFHNVHPTTIVASPTRLILKLGDDLRQDMITLRMFSLFEKVCLYELCPTTSVARSGSSTKWIRLESVFEMKSIELTKRSL